MATRYNENIRNLLSLAREMMSIADEGDKSRLDASCGKLFGLLREYAYRLHWAAQNEKELHQQNGIWDALEIKGRKEKLKG